MTSLIKEFLNDITSNERMVEIVETMRQLGFKEEWEMYYQYLVNMNLAVAGATSWEAQQEEEEVRTCSKCEKEIYVGGFFVVNDGCEHYCSKECLHLVYSEKKYQEMYLDDTAYWTTVE